MRDFTKNQKARLFTNTALGIAAIGAFGLILAQAFVASPAIGQAAKKKAVTQRVVPAPVSYWMDVSNGGASMMPAMPFGFGRGGDNNMFGEAYNGGAGKHADMSILHKDFPRQINAVQALPKGVKLGNSLNLIPTPATAPAPRHEDETPRAPAEMPNFKMSIYWGCGPTVRQGQPRIFEIRNGQMASTLAAMQSRGESERYRSNELDSNWPNARDKRDFATDASLFGNHTLSGANVPASLNFAISAAQDFMGDLGLRSSGATSDVITLNWNSVSGAKAYFFNAFGMRGVGQNDGEMIMWSASEVPDMGSGLVNYLRPSNITRFLQERAILPPTQTSCQIPRGIFANTQMVMVRGIGYGDETNLVYPARPADVNIPWIQEWTARFRNKTMATLMLGMPGMGDMSGGRGNPSAYESDEPADAPSNANPQAGQTNPNNNAACENARQTGGGLGAAIGRGIGQYRGGTLGRITGNAIGGAAGTAAAGQTANCQPPPAQPKGN
ncbi:MAG: hypothetical protein FD163_606 [Hyphomonadaceae bacterium]|nr:MAG: hypothetical protein FD163_606 [Hyphomonadaceae bacterium]